MQRITDIIIGVVPLAVPGAFFVGVKSGDDRPPQDDSTSMATKNENFPGEVCSIRPSGDEPQL